MEILFNFINLPCKITRSLSYRDRFGNIKKTMQNFYYRYLADGAKISVADSAGNGFLYLGAARFAYDANGTSFESMPFSSGRIVNSSNGYEPQYHFTDHLGSTRVVATYDNGWTDIQRKNYSPFGKEWETPFFPESGNDLTFSGKEKQTLGDIGFLDFGARFYGSEGAIFLQQDPLAEKYYNIGQYNYCAGNPIKFVDPDGNIWVDANGNQMWNNGKWTKYATPQMKEIGKTLLSIPTGKEQFNKLVSNPAMISITLEDSGNPAGTVYGKADSTVSAKTGELVTTEITVYKDRAETRAAKSEGAFTTIEAIAINIGHEIEHTTKDNVELRNKYGNKYYTDEDAHNVIEVEPRKVTQNMKNEYRDNKPIIVKPLTDLQKL